MSSITDRAGGILDQLKSKAKKVYGEMTHDDQTKAEAKLDEASGQYKEKKADIKDAVKDKIDRT